MSDSRKRHEALLYQAKPKPGKIEVTPTKKYATQHDLSLAYSPGVAEPCLEMDKDPNKAYEYLARVLSCCNYTGTAV